MSAAVGRRGRARRRMAGSAGEVEPGELEGEVEDEDPLSEGLGTGSAAAASRAASEG